VTPTREEIRQAFDTGYEAVVALIEATCRKLEERIKVQELGLKELERRLNQNSQNSHKPPSSDGPSKGHFRAMAPRRATLDLSDRRRAVKDRRQAGEAADNGPSEGHL